MDMLLLYFIAVFAVINWACLILLLWTFFTFRDSPFMAAFAIPALLIISTCFGYASYMMLLEWWQS